MSIRPAETLGVAGSRQGAPNVGGGSRNGVWKVRVRENFAYLPPTIDCLKSHRVERRKRRSRS